MAIFTIGYGSRRFADLVSLLKEHHIAFIVDVRRFPKSTVLEYNREYLKAKLPQFGISYIFMGEIPWVDFAEVATANIWNQIVNKVA